jgi:hypothetical protein
MERFLDFVEANQFAGEPLAFVIRADNVGKRSPQ